jgi:hypothetical protein
MSLHGHQIAETFYWKGVPDHSTYTYSLYGLSIRSQWKLPLTESEEPCHAAIELVEGSASLFEEVSQTASRLPVDTDWLHYTRLPDGAAYLRRPGLYEFLISPDGRRIAGRLAREGVPYEAFHAYLLGAALAFSLVRLGCDPLHATVVEADGSAFGFLGQSGHGKSTLAGTLFQKGYPIVTDDLLVLKHEGNGFAAYQGPPRIKLNPRMAKILLGEKAAGVPMNPETRKLIIPLSRRQTARSVVPLSVLYALNRPSRGARNGRITIRRLSQSRALLALLKHSFNGWINEPGRLNQLLQSYSQIASQVPIKLLSYPRRLDRLPAVRAAILADLRR